MGDIRKYGKRGVFMTGAVACLACAMALALSACGGSTKSTTATSTTTTGTAASQTATTGTATSQAATASKSATSKDSTSAQTSTSVPDDRTQTTMESLFTIAYAGVGDDGNYYFLACDDNVDYAAFVILSSDGSQSMNAVGQVTEDGTYLTIDDTYSGYTLTFNVESADNGVTLTMKDGTKVSMASVDPSKVISMIIAIDDNTQIVNPLA